MNKILKITGIIILALAGLLVLLILLFFGMLEYGSYARRKEARELQRNVCDTITTVPDSMYFRLDGFKPAEVPVLHCYLIRYGKVINRQVLHIGKASVNEDIPVPFAHFRITDSVVIEAPEKHFYTLSGIAYFATFPHYGMMGPVGKCECLTTGWQLINRDTVRWNGITLIKERGEKNQVIEAIISKPD